MDDFVSENNSMQVTDVYVNHLYLFDLGFNSVNPKSTGRPNYHPATMRFSLKADVAENQQITTL